MPSTILLFGAGKSATALIEYLISEAANNNWQIFIVDANKEQILSKTNNAACVQAFAINVKDDAQRAALIQQADIVISLMPPALHILIAKDCVAYNKNLLTASYIDEEVKSLSEEIKSKGLLFLYEMGLDPGIDHMSAMQLVDDIKSKGGEITSFKSHCGGLVAPESDNNPWHYKISWNPRNVVMAGKAGAVYKLRDEIITETYEQLFNADAATRYVQIPAMGYLSCYPNRDSLTYVDIYGLQQASTFIRTTLRHPDFMFGWRNMVNFKLTNETTTYETDGLSVAEFFKIHFANHGLSSIISKSIALAAKGVKLLQQIETATKMQEEATRKGKPFPDNYMYVNAQGDFEDFNIKKVTKDSLDTIPAQLHELNLMLEQLYCLGVYDMETFINKGKCSAADVLQFILETKLTLNPGDKDMVVMCHEIDYTLAGKNYHIQSNLMVTGENEINTAMAKTVGLPLGIAAKLILNKTIKLTGLHIPVSKEIYKVVLPELKQFGISFTEMVTVNDEPHST